jgi:hypothetical protein
LPRPTAFALNGNAQAKLFRRKTRSFGPTAARLGPTRDAGFAEVIKPILLARMQIEHVAILHAHGLVGEGGRSDGPRSSTVLIA